MNNSTIARTLVRGIRLSAAAALLTGLLAVTQPARAFTYMVKNSNDSGLGSLRQAITAANNNPGADTITFATATNGNPIVLTKPAGEDANVSGDLDILDNGDLTIQGNGAANTIIDGGGIDRVFHICPDGGCANTVTLRRVTIRNGCADYGGGIYNYDGTTTVDSSTVSDNMATNYGGGIYNRGALNVLNGSTIGGVGASNNADYGGGIYNWGGTTTVDGSTVSANTVTWNGGGIFNKATLIVQNGSTIGGVGAANTANYSGGGIYNYDGTTTVDSSTVSANKATNKGGGIYNEATLNVQNGSTIGGAGASNQADRGGGIYNVAGTTTVDGSTVSANTANDGGGIYNWGTLNVLKGSTIGGAGAANTADNDGGGIYNHAGPTTVDGSTVSANTATSNGGGIYNRATLNVQNGSTIGGAGVGNQANFGGGIYNDNSTTTVNGSTVSANTAILGGGIYNEDGTTTMTGSRILNNTANNSGGVFNSSDIAGATSVTGSCIVGNSAVSFFNNQATQQIATGNWWGAATGPNTTGADTVLGNVNVSDHLTAPILGCAPDLQVGKSNDTGGNGTVGTPFHWTLTVANTGIISATFDALQTILVDELPAGPTYGAPVACSFVDVANSANIQCSLVGNTLTCAAAGGDVTLGAITGSFEVTFSVTPGALVTLVNPAGICQVDPDGNVTENDESNNDCPANVVNVAVSTNYLYLPLVMK
jgi:hypothetical protein